MFSEVWVDVWKIEVKGVLFICFIKSLFKSISQSPTIYIYIYTHIYGAWFIYGLNINISSTSSWLQLGFNQNKLGFTVGKRALDSSSGIPDWPLSHLWKIKKHEATCDHWFIICFVTVSRYTFSSCCWVHDFLLVL